MYRTATINLSLWPMAWGRMNCRHSNSLTSSDDDQKGNVRGRGHNWNRAINENQILHFLDKQADLVPSSSGQEGTPKKRPHVLVPTISSVAVVRRWLLIHILCHFLRKRECFSTCTNTFLGTKTKCLHFGFFSAHIMFWYYNSAIYLILGTLTAFAFWQQHAMDCHHSIVRSTVINHQNNEKGYFAGQNDIVRICITHNYIQLSCFPQDIKFGPPSFSRLWRKLSALQLSSQLIRLLLISSQSRHHHHF